MLITNVLLFEAINFERLEWLSECILENYLPNIRNSELSNTQIGEINFFFTGDSIFSLIDKRFKKIWKKMVSPSEITLYVDPDELELYGFDLAMIDFNIVSNVNFWDNLIAKSKNNFSDNLMGFLQFDGPYMSRSSVHMLRFLTAALLNNLNIQLYSYLDGVHLGHKMQNPSEFENIAEGLIEVKNQANEKNLEFLMLACSRCGTARGYLKNADLNDFVQSNDVLSSYLFCNLNKIIDKFEENHNIYSKCSLLIQNPYNKSHKKNPNLNKIKPTLLIFITHSSYGSEWTFGGLSLAVACANHDIHTQVIFIEDGVYCLFGEHTVSEEDKLFNIQEIINATGDMDNLEYFAFSQSLQHRGIQCNKGLEDVRIINNNELVEILFFLQDNNIQKRVFFF
ncbi:MAG: DsrE family protein [Candidatus Odinarchaeota archaeon]